MCVEKAPQPATGQCRASCMDALGLEHTDTQPMMIRVLHLAPGEIKVAIEAKAREET